MDAQGKEHIAEMGQVVGYAKRVQHKPLMLQKPVELQLVSKTDSNYAADAADQ